MRVPSFLALGLLSQRTYGFQAPTTFVSKGSLFSAIADDVTTDDAATGQRPMEPDYLATRDGIMSEVRASGKLPREMEGFLEHFVTEYGLAIQESDADAKTFGKNIQNAIQYGLKYGMPNSPDLFTFGVKHEAVRDEIDFYEWGCDFFRPCMDWKHSVVLGEDNLRQAFEYMKKGENVVFFANHQSEADPQVFSCALETVGMGEEAEKIYYVAGHKVTTDTLAIPFSMGRNLLCIHSKKHLNVDPSTKSDKMRQNLMTMSAMQRMMKAGGNAFWVAPSGGRDRRLTERRVPPADFDQKTIDMFRLMSNKAKTPTHFYSLAMVSYDLCPPPDTVEAGTGELRNVRFSPIGVACSPELENEGGVESRHVFTERAMAEVQREYDALQDAIEAKQAD